MSYSPKLTPFRCYPGSSSKHVEFTDSDLSHSFAAHWPYVSPSTGPDYQTVTIQSQRSGGELYYFGSLSCAYSHMLVRLGPNTTQSLQQTCRGTDSGNYTFGDDKFFGVTSSSITLATQGYYSSSGPRGDWNANQIVNIFIFAEG